MKHTQCWEVESRSVMRELAMSVEEVKETIIHKIPVILPMEGDAWRNMNRLLEEAASHGFERYWDAR